MNIYQYAVGEDDDLYEVESCWYDEESNRIAEDAARDYFHNHDGWNDLWPISFEIFNPEGESVGYFEVELEAVPEFLASEKARYIE